MAISMVYERSSASANIAFEKSDNLGRAPTGRRASVAHHIAILIRYGCGFEKLNDVIEAVPHKAP